MILKFFFLFTLFLHFLCRCTCLGLMEQNNRYSFETEFYFACVPPPSGKIGRGDVCESPTIIVFPFPRNVGDSLSLGVMLMP